MSADESDFAALTNLALAVNGVDAQEQTWLLMSATTRALLAMFLGRPADQETWLADATAVLAGIPILLDNELPTGAWRLLDRSGHEIRRGGFPAATEGDQP